jgi:hypothetical protein
MLGLTEKKTNDAGETLKSTDETLRVRGARYGRFSEVADTHTMLLQALRLEEPGVINTASQYVSINMICQKLARIVNGDPNYDDNWRDIAGYAELIVKQLNGEDP